MSVNMNKCIDIRGREDLKTIFNDINEMFGTNSFEETADQIERLMKKMDLNINIDNNENIDELIDCVNVNRLKNHPIELDKESVRYIYSLILKQ